MLDVVRRRPYQWMAARAVDAGAEIRVKETVEHAPSPGGTSERRDLSRADPRRVPGPCTTFASNVVSSKRYHRVRRARSRDCARPNGARGQARELEVARAGFDQDEAVFLARAGQRLLRAGTAGRSRSDEHRVRLGVGASAAGGPSRGGVARPPRRRAARAGCRPAADRRPMRLPPAVLMRVLPPTATNYRRFGVRRRRRCRRAGSTVAPVRGSATRASAGQLAERPRRRRWRIHPARARGLIPAAGRSPDGARPWTLSRSQTLNCNSATKRTGDARSPLRRSCRSGQARRGFASGLRYDTRSAHCSMTVVGTRWPRADQPAPIDKSRMSCDVAVAFTV